MNGSITIAAVEKKTAKSGEPYLRVQSQSKKWYSVWEPAIFHLFEVGKTLQVTTVVKGDFTNITDVIDNDGTAHVTTEQVQPRNVILEAVQRIERKVDTLLAHLPEQLAPDEKRIPLD